LSDSLKKGISALRVRYRYRTDLYQSVLDVSKSEHKVLGAARVKSVGLVGHSFGGAIVVQAATVSDAVSTIVTLSTQSYGTKDVSRPKQYCLILLKHGSNDEVLPPYCLSYTYNLANDPKELIFYKGAKHGLDEVAEQVHQVIYDWPVKHL
jgi:dienelactone hydrolase